MSGNYPDGTGPNDPRAPWNQPEIEITTDEILDYIEDEVYGDLYYEDEDEGWSVELPDGTWLPVETEQECILILLFDRESWLEEQVDERDRERAIDRAERIADGDY